MSKEGRCDGTIVWVRRQTGAGNLKTPFSDGKGSVGQWGGYGVGNAWGGDEELKADDDSGGGGMAASCNVQIRSRMFVRMQKLA